MVNLIEPSIIGGSWLREITMTPNDSSRPRQFGVGKVVGLIAAGVLSGGIAVSAIGAAAATSTSPSSTASSSAGSSGSGTSNPAAPAPNKQSTPVRSDEQAVSDSVAATLKAAALKAVPGGTVFRVETDAGDAAYEAHLTKADGSVATVKFDKNLAVTKVETGMGRGDPAAPR
jgi:hypothetical protein